MNYLLHHHSIRSPAIVRYRLQRLKTSDIFLKEKNELHKIYLLTFCYVRLEIEMK